MSLGDDRNELRAPLGPPPRGPGPRKRLLSRSTRRTITKIAFVAPAMGLFSVFYLVPVVVGIVMSFFEWDGLETPAFVGLDNYRSLFADPVFGTNVRVSLIVIGVSLVTTLPAALLLALCLSGDGRMLGFFRSILFVPAIIPLAAVALLWSEIFNPVGGLANHLTDAVGIDSQAWLGDEDIALWALIGVTVWTTLGFHVVLQLSFLSAIPTDLKEAARLETSSRWMVFRYVTLPLLRDGLTVSATLIITGSFVFFTGIAFIMTQGGPLHATEVLGLRAYLAGFQQTDFGTANAVTVIAMLITMVLVGVTLLVGSRNRIEY